ncbi:MAG: alpha/beta hydrolase [Deltaproteobacteria bacterium]|nr:alpha/beta hydrolase [Deltaproteobacteria bacterium]
MTQPTPRDARAHVTVTPSSTRTRSGTFGVLTITAPEVPPRETVLYLHGFPDHPLSCMGFLTRIARSGRRVVAPFLRGYAPSPIDGPFTLEQLVDDAVALLDTLAPRERVSVVGHDWGAAITYGLCALHPTRVRRAVTMAVPHSLQFLSALRDPSQRKRSAYMALFQLPWLPEALLRLPHGLLVRALWRRWSPGFSLDAQAQRALLHTLTQSGAAPIEFYRAMTRPVGAAIARLRGPMAAPITVPVLHLQGARDGCIAPSACVGQERYFSGEFASEVVPSVGHFLAHEAPEVIATRVISWLNQGESLK